MKKHISITLICLAITVILGVVLANYYGSSAQRAYPELGRLSSAENHQAAYGSEESVPYVPGTVVNYEYIVKNYGGRVAVFKSGGEEPELVLDLFTHSLPELDQQRLEDGINVRNYKDLLRLIEDYIS